MGCTTLLRGLERVGHTVALAPHKPPPAARSSWCQAYFDRLVQYWHALPREGRAIFIEDSPWAYLTKHASSLTAAHRADLHATLAPLTLPNLTLTLHTSGRNIGLRHPHHRTTPDLYSPIALAQMQHLALLADPCYQVDASPAVPLVLQRVRRLLSTKVFHANEAAFEGMDHLAGTPPSLTITAAEAVAKRHHLQTFSTTTPAGLRRLERFAAITAANADLVNPALPTADQGRYY